MIKHIDPKNLSQRHVYKFSYPGKTTGEIAEAVDNIAIVSNPSHVIIHTGTNNLPASGADKHENCALCEESTIFGTEVAYDGISRFGYGATSKMTSLPSYGGLKHGTEAES